MVISYQPRLPNAPRPPVPHEVRGAVLVRDKGLCVYCGSRGPLVLDHVYPFAQGGSTTVENLVAACRICNAIAGDRVFPEFHAKKDWVQWARAELPPEVTDALVRQMYDDGT